jgi:uncharacterized repeat protein (TIGR01451 family)
MNSKVSLLMRIVVSLAALLAGLAWPTPAGAAPLAALAIGVTPGSGPPAGQVVVTGSGFSPGASIELHWDALDSPLIGNALGRDGSFTTVATIPPDASAGWHDLIASAGQEQASARFQVQGQPRLAVYIYNADQNTAAAYRDLLQNTGMLITELLPLSGVAQFDFSGVDLVLVGPDTGAGDTWGGAGDAEHVRDAGKPILCLGQGGNAFFGKLHLHLGPGFAKPGSGQTATPADPSQPVYHTPYPVSTGAPISLYAEASPLVYLPGPSRSYVNPVGGQPGNDDYTLAEQSARYFLWGFDHGPAQMTQAGRELLVNVAWDLLQRDLTIDTLILVDYQRMQDIGYAAADVNTLESLVSSLVLSPTVTSNMKAVVKRLNLDAPEYVRAARSTWIAADASLAATNGYVDNIDAYIENLKKGSYPNLEYVVFVGAHEVIPQKPRSTDDMTSHPESGWASGLPQTSGYLYSLYHDTSEAPNLGHYLTDSVYGDLSYINNGYGADDELIPELAVGRLVETPAQISTILTNYMAASGHLTRGDMAAIGSVDYMDGATVAASEMEYAADTSLIQSGFTSSQVPGVINAHPTFIYIGGHGDYNWMTTRAWDQGFMAGSTGGQGDTEELNLMPNAVVVASGCHNGVSLGNQRYHDYTGNTTYGDFPERFAGRGVGVYLGSSGYTWISDADTNGNPCNAAWCNGWSELLATNFLDALLQGYPATAGSAFKDAVNAYVAGYSDWGDPVNPHRRVLAIANLYGMPHYHWPQPLVIPWDKFKYRLMKKFVWPPEPTTLVDEYLSLDVLEWDTTPQGYLDIPGMPGAAGTNAPAMPRVSAGRALPPDSQVTGVVWDAGGSISTTIVNDLPLVNMTILSDTVPNTFLTGSAASALSAEGFYPLLPYYTSSASMPGGGGVQAGLTLTPVQYNPTTHQTRIWTHLAFSVTYQVDAYGLVTDDDGDGLPTFWEMSYGLDPNDAKGDQGASGDPDRDGLTNERELELGTDPLRADTDGDAGDDAAELEAGSDPLDPGDRLHDLALVQQASPDPVKPGAALTYTLWVTNTGALALDALVTDSLPAQVTPSDVLTWNTGTLAPGAAWSQTILVGVEAGASGPLSNTVEVSSPSGPADIDVLTTQVATGKLYLPVILRQ